MAREGFARGSMVTFALLSLVLLASLFVGGTKVQISPEHTVQVGIGATILAVGVAAGLTGLAYRNAVVFNRYKINNVLVLFLALCEKDASRDGG